MRQARLRSPETINPAYYHIVSRVVNRQLLIDDQAKESFVQMMRDYEAFTGIRVLTYAVMSNHVHLLIEVTRPEDDEITDGEVVRRVGAYSDTLAATLRSELKELRKAGKDKLADKKVAAWTCRMWDPSPFMKTLKQKFTQWINRHTGRRGTLWEERFTSVMIEGGSEALAMTAAYIDLNAVRAGLVKDPVDFPWCGYSAAQSGHRLAKQGLAICAAGLAPGQPRKAQEAYRHLLVPSVKLRKPEELAADLQAGVRLTPAEMLRCRVRYFTGGAVLGSKDFVNQIFHAERSRFGPNRRSGARPMRGLTKESPLHSLRALQKDVFGPRPEQPAKLAAKKVTAKAAKRRSAR
jgi:putative transposase